MASMKNHSGAYLILKETAGLSVWGYSWTCNTGLGNSNSLTRVHFILFPLLCPPPHSLLPAHNSSSSHKSQQGYQSFRCKHISKGCLRALPLAGSTHTSHCCLLFTVRSSAAHLTAQAGASPSVKEKVSFLHCILATFVKLITEHLVHNSCSINERWDCRLIIRVAIIIGDGDGVFIGSFISLSTLQIQSASPPPSFSDVYVCREQ